ncbi:MAG: hypothetical protein ACKOOL_13385 [Novosphingobium sp.]
MSETEQRLLADRANRKAARALVDGDVAQVKADLSARGIGGRIKDKALREVQDAAATGIEVARENKPVIAGTIGLLLVWFMREPLGRLVRRAFGNKSDEIQEPGDSHGSSEDADQE